MAESTTNYEVSLNRETYNQLQNAVASEEQALMEKTKKRDEIKKAIERLSNVLGKSSSEVSGTNSSVEILGQGQNTFSWVANNMDLYWNASNSTARESCQKNLRGCAEFISNITAEASNIIEAAQIKLDSLNAEIAAIEARITSYNSQLATLEEEYNNLVASTTVAETPAESDIIIKASEKNAPDTIVVKASDINDAIKNSNTNTTSETHKTLNTERVTR